MANIDIVNSGFRILRTTLSEVVGMKMNQTYGDRWWNEVLSCFYDIKNLPAYGEYGELIDSLDIANCLDVIESKWNDIFIFVFNKDKRYRSYGRELKAVRNIVSHPGREDLDDRTTVRALDTMVLMCDFFDGEQAAEIQAILDEMRGANFENPVYYTGIAQPESESSRGTLQEGNLLDITDETIIQKTNDTRKVLYDGKAVIYPVYKVRLDYLFYNDQNDRIATWISQYESENGEGSLYDLDQDIYNQIIEQFICESNPDAIKTTKKDIDLYGQNVAGVALADGRIVDGNRRFTCLRQLQRERKEPVYFETAIVDMDIRADKKQIKQLELSIQHGEESKVSYDLIEFAIGTYKTVKLEKLFTVEEYAQYTKEKKADVKKRIEIAEIICEFLEYIKLPKQYHVAREYQVYSLFNEMLPQLKGKEKENIKQICFNNALTGAVPDRRKFIRDIKKLSATAGFSDFCKEQISIGNTIMEKYANADIHDKQDADTFVKEQESLVQDLRDSMENALRRSRDNVIKNQPGDVVNKCIASLVEVDTRLFAKLNPEETEELISNLDRLMKLVEMLKGQL